MEARLAQNAMFVSQETVDKWITEGRVSVGGEMMTLMPEGRRFALTSAVHFVAEVADGGDEQQLVGKVKALEVVAEIGGEHYADSVILDDNAYEVVEGFLGVNAGIDHHSAEHAAHDLAAATRLAVGEERLPSAELDLLARFFLNEN